MPGMYTIRMPRELTMPLSLNNTSRVSKESELPDELFFFNSVYHDNYWGLSERNKAQVPGAAYLRKIEWFMEDH